MDTGLFSIQFSFTKKPCHGGNRMVKLITKPPPSPSPCQDSDTNTKFNKLVQCYQHLTFNSPLPDSYSASNNGHIKTRLKNPWKESSSMQLKSKMFPLLNSNAACT